jgi:hypothetical protein
VTSCKRRIEVVKVRVVFRFAVDRPGSGAPDKPTTWFDKLLRILGKTFVSFPAVLEGRRYRVDTSVFSVYHHLWTVVTEELPEVRRFTAPTPQ